MQRPRRLPLATDSERQRRPVMTNTEDNVSGASAKRAHADAPLEVLVIGTGFSGVCVGIKLLEQGIRNFRIYEKSQGIGGTWYENTYPGAACDVPSHFYCYSFEPNPNWSRVYSLQAEIQAYIEQCVDLIERVRTDKAA